MVSAPTQGLSARLMKPLGNENEVGQGIRDSGVPREQIFLTSKLWNTHQPNVEEGLQKTLDALGTDYLDLYVQKIFKATERPAELTSTTTADPLASKTCSCMVGSLSSRLKR